MSPFEEKMANRLLSAGLAGTEVTGSPSEAPDFGDPDVVFLVGRLLLRFVRDRGQIFLEIAARAVPEKFHQFDDIEIAMGWRTIEEVLNKREPEAIDQILIRLAQHFEELDIDFSGEHWLFTKKRIERAAQARGRAFVERLHTIARDR